MQRFISIVISLITLVTLSNAQDHKGNFQKGSKALLFEFSGLAYLGAGSFDGGLGGKYFIDNKMAIRGSLQFMDTNEDIPFQAEGGVDGRRSATHFGISAAIEVHFDTSRVNPYFGAGLGFGITSTERKTAANDIINQITIKNDQNGEFGYYGGTQFSVFGLLGVEVFIIDNLSISAEYRLSYISLSRKDEEVTQGNTTVTTRQNTLTELGLESSGALILAVYF